MSSLSLFNSLTRRAEPFSPLEGETVRLYTCGPTVYNYQHIGNFRTYLFEDLLRRTLVFAGFGVRHVMNITDVGHLTSDADSGEDKMEKAAQAQGKNAWELARFYEKDFFDRFGELGCLFPDVVCRATDHIEPMIEMVRKLEANGLTYRIEDGIYFDTEKFNAYGALLSEAHLKGLKAGARVEQAEGKRGVADFALWKFSPKDENRQMEWDSPWGRGFPGWHIECSAMAMKYLGETFDIHCGGVDHIPIHHTNEIAQAEGATGKPFVKVWMHGEFLVMNKAKMAKSAGGFLTLADLKAKGFDPRAFRLFSFNAHYRTQLDFSWESVEAAQKSLEALRGHFATWKREQKAGTRDVQREQTLEERFRDAVFDDMNLPKAMAVVWDTARSDLQPASKLALFETYDRVLALDFGKEDGAEALPEGAQELLERRETARREKDWGSSDALRDELAALGVEVRDGADGQTWKVRAKG